MKILGIESSCDDTSVALLDINDEGVVVLAEKTASQIEIHKKYGGVVPEIAGRKHAEKILPVVEEVMEGYDIPDAIAVTSGPGLITGLLVGVEVAKALSYLWDVPLVRTNHIEGHIYSVKLPSYAEASAGKQDTNYKIQNFEFPTLCLIVSGGHTELILMKDHGVYEKLGGTRDDAAGECFDKVAKLLGFDYPGGPKISQFAMEGNPAAIAFPRPMKDSPNFDMSFSGLKTAALYWLQDNQSDFLSRDPSTPLRFAQDDVVDVVSVEDFCASFEQAIVDVLVKKTLKAVKKYNPKTIILAGGVSANKKLRETLEKSVKEAAPDSKFLRPLPKYCMDNAAMIAVAGYYHARNDDYTYWDELAADPQWRVYE